MIIPQGSWARKEGDTDLLKPRLCSEMGFCNLATEVLIRSLLWPSFHFFLQVANKEFS